MNSAKPAYDLVAIGKKLRRNPQYLAHLIRYGGVTPHLAEKLSVLTGLSIGFLIHRRLPVSRQTTGGGKARGAQRGRARQRSTAS